MSGDANSYDDGLDGLFQEEDADLRAEKVPEATVWLPGVERPVIIPGSPEAFRAKLERDLEQVETLLGLEPGEARSDIEPRRIMSEPAIEHLIAANPIFCPVKPDQADPLLARLPNQARAGEQEHAIPAWPSLERVKRLRLVGEAYRERGNAVVGRAILHFFGGPRREFARAAELHKDDLVRLSERFENLVDDGMNMISGSQGHWDRDSRWPSALLLLQAMSVACRVAGGRSESLTELASIDRNIDSFDLSFIQSHVDSYRVSLKRLGIDIAAVEGGL
jgi:hypothetical protein